MNWLYARDLLKQFPLSGWGDGEEEGEVALGSLRVSITFP